MAHRNPFKYEHTRVHKIAEKDSSLSAIKGFLLEKGQSGKTELPPGQGENGTECPT
jgi:hypothetical protein